MQQMHTNNNQHIRSIIGNVHHRKPCISCTRTIIGSMHHITCSHACRIQEKNRIKNYNSQGQAMKDICWQQMSVLQLNCHTACMYKLVCAPHSTYNLPGIPFMGQNMQSILTIVGKNKIIVRTIHFIFRIWIFLTLDTYTFSPTKVMQSLTAWLH